MGIASTNCIRLLSLKILVYIHSPSDQNAIIEQSHNLIQNSMNYFLSSSTHQLFLNILIIYVHYNVQ